MRSHTSPSTGYTASVDQLYISAVTLAELRFGIERLGEGANRRDELTDRITHTIRPMFHQRVLAVTEDIMLRWRLLVEEGRKSGHTYSQPDLIIAATALEHRLTLVTRDQGEFDMAGVVVLDPWTAA